MIRKEKNTFNIGPAIHCMVGLFLIMASFSSSAIEISSCKKSLSSFFSRTINKKKHLNYHDLANKDIGQGIKYLKQYQNQYKNIPLHLILNFINFKFGKDTIKQVRNTVSNQKDSVSDAVLYLRNSLQPELFKQIFPEVNEISIKEKSFLSFGLSIKHPRTFPIIGTKNKKKLFLKSSPIGDYIDFYKRLTLDMIELNHQETSHVFFKSKVTPKRYAHNQATKALRNLKQYYELMNKLMAINPEMKVEQLVDTKETRKIFSLLWNAQLQAMLPIKTFHISSTPTQKGFYHYMFDPLFEEKYYKRYYRIYYTKWLNDQGWRIFWGVGIIPAIISIINNPLETLQSIENTITNFDEGLKSGREFLNEYEEAQKEVDLVQIPEIDIDMNYVTSTITTIQTMESIKGDDPTSSLYIMLGKDIKDQKHKFIDKIKKLNDFGKTNLEISQFIKSKIPNFKEFIITEDKLTITYTDDK